MVGTRYLEMQYSNRFYQSRARVGLSAGGFVHQIRCRRLTVSDLYCATGAGTSFEIPWRKSYMTSRPAATPATPSSFIKRWQVSTPSFRCVQRECTYLTANEIHICGLRDTGANWDRDKATPDYVPSSHGYSTAHGHEVERMPRNGGA